MASCDGCGGFVTSPYRRVFEVDGVLHGCYHCEAGTGDHGPPNTHPAVSEKRGDERARWHQERAGTAPGNRPHRIRRQRESRESREEGGA